MQQFLWPVLFALFLWWFTTGLIFYLDGLPTRTFRWSFLGATVLLFVSLWGLVATRDDTSMGGAYLAFTWGTLAWGWQMTGYYMGLITGPRCAACPPEAHGLRRFWYALQTCLYHELAAIGGALLILVLTWGGANQIGLWTYVLMMWMHQSAKLNVFFGVPNLDVRFLPEHLKFLSSYIPKRPLNAFFPISVTISTLIAFVWVQQALTPGISLFESIQYTFLGFLMLLAILEHWLLVVPLPMALWDWSLRAREVPRPEEAPVEPAPYPVAKGLSGE